MTIDPEDLAADTLNEFPAAAYTVHATLAAYRAGYLTSAEACEDLQRAAQIERLKTGELA